MYSVFWEGDNKQRTLGMWGIECQGAYIAWMGELESMSACSQVNNVYKRKVSSVCESKSMDALESVQTS